MNKRIQPKPQTARQTSITVPMSKEDYLYHFFATIESYEINRHKLKFEPINEPNTGNTGLILSLDNFSHQDGMFSIDFYERLRILKNNTVQILEYRYAAKQIYNQEEYFRADFQPQQIPKKFAPYHINASEKLYGQSHFVYPDDTNIRLDLLNAISGFQIIRYYEKTYVNPVDRHNPQADNYVQLSKGDSTHVNL
jgi:hypothetical protein